MFILAEDGSGTGFIVDAEGRILTNHHVVAEPGLDDETGARRVRAYIGLLDPKDSTMRVIQDGVTALIYKEDPVKDLALLKLAKLPSQVKALTKIDLAAGEPRLTDECISIGHPSGGQLWTVRVGHVTATGRWPGDRLQETVELLRSDKLKHHDIEERFRTAPGRRVVLSDCITGAGDSGGPLLDTDGRLIGVTFGGPASSRAAQLSYHIHLDEVRAFLAEVPAKPMMYEPDPWSEVMYAKPPFDVDDDGIPETLLLWSRPDEPPAAILVDLGQKSRLGKFEPANDLDQLKRDWHPTFAITLVGGRPYKAFYDTDDDRAMDLVLTAAPSDPNKAGDRTFPAIRRKGRRWFTAEPRAGSFIDLSLIPGREKQGRLELVIRQLVKAKVLGDKAGGER